MIQDPREGAGEVIAGEMERLEGAVVTCLGSGDLAREGVVGEVHELQRLQVPPAVGELARELVVGQVEDLEGEEPAEGRAGAGAVGGVAAPHAEALGHGAAGEGLVGSAGVEVHARRPLGRG